MNFSSLSTQHRCTLVQQGRPAITSRPTAWRPCRETRLASLADTSTEVSTKRKQQLYDDLNISCENVRRAPFLMKLDYSKEVKSTMEQLKTAGFVSKWGAAVEEDVQRRNVFVGELRQVGIKNPDKIAIPSIRNDAAFLWTSVGVSSFLAVIAGTTLPGDWGFFSAYLLGGIPIGILAIGSTAPGLLQVAIDKFSQVFPDYRERVVRHEAAHFLVGYLLGVPVAGYSITLGQEHTEFAEAKLEARIIEKTLTDQEINTLALVAVAGMTAEGQAYEEVLGQTADLSDLQRLLLRSATRLSDAQQQSITRWAVYKAGGLLRTYTKELEALMSAMARGASVGECIQAIESA